MDENVKLGLEHALEHMPDDVEFNVDIEREGSKIVVPATPEMEYQEAARLLLAKEKAEGQETVVSETIQAFTWDGCIALGRALKQLYGWVPQADGGFSKRPPMTVAVPTDAYGGQTHVPMGWFEIPGTGWEVCVEGHGMECRFMGSGPRKHHKEIMRLVELVRKLAREQSIYRGKAIILRQTSNEATGEDTIDAEPLEFVGPDRKSYENLVLPEDLERAVQVNLFTPIINTEACRKHGIALKRSVLLAGRYGTGKTMTAAATAWLCEQHGWTFILVRDPNILRECLEFARRYQPCVVFVEDVDRLTSSRSDTTNDLLNTLDGVVSKTAEIITVFTTNHLERIHPSMLRPGRLDMIAEFQGCDASSAERLIIQYSGDALAERDGLEAVGKLLIGQIPAAVKEVTERAKLASVFRDPEAKEITVDDLLTAAQDVARHTELLDNATAQDEETDAEKLFHGISVAATTSPGSQKVKQNGRGARR